MLDDFIKHAIIQETKKYDLNKIILFGSRARGDNSERSDIDLAADFVSAAQYFNFCDSLEEIETPLIFDIIDLSSDMIDLNLRKTIRDEGVTLYEKV